MSSSTSHNIHECPICMDTIDPDKNIIVTECGHKFHCSCLMKNVSYNGMDCPFCRNKMADDVDEEEDEESVDDEEEDRYWDEESTEAFDLSDNTLVSFRMFHQRINCEEVEEEEEEEVEEEEEEEDEEIEDVGDGIKCFPSSLYLMQKLQERNITMEMFVNNYLYGISFGQRYHSDARRIDGNVEDILKKYNRDIERNAL